MEHLTQDRTLASAFLTRLEKENTHQNLWHLTCSLFLSLSLFSTLSNFSLYTNPRAFFPSLCLSRLIISVWKQTSFNFQVSLGLSLQIRPRELGTALQISYLLCLFSWSLEIFFFRLLNYLGKISWNLVRVCSFLNQLCTFMFDLVPPSPNALFGTQFRLSSSLLGSDVWTLTFSYPLS